MGGVEGKGGGLYPNKNLKVGNLALAASWEAAGRGSAARLSSPPAWTAISKDFSSARVKKEFLASATPGNFYYQDINITILCNLHTFTTGTGTAVGSWGGGILALTRAVGAAYQTKYMVIKNKKYVYCIKLSLTGFLFYCSILSL